jgi:YidC/Oxa1 family membrane protein insertase
MSQDTKRLILAMTVALGLMFGWQAFMRWKWPDYYKQQATTQEQPQTAPATQPTTRATTGSTTSPIATTQAAAPPGGWRARGDDAPATTRPVALGSAGIDDPKFAMAVDVARRGAAIDSVVLNSFRKTAEDPVTRYSFQTPYQNETKDYERTRPFLTREINVEGAAIDLRNIVWRVESSKVDSATFSIDVLQNDRPIAKVFKVYQLSERSTDPKSPQGYQMLVSHRFQNLTDRPIAFKAAINGPTEPPRELESQPDQNIVAGYWKEGEVTVFSHLVAGEFAKQSWKEFTKSDKGLPLVWAGTQSAYFEALVRPIPLAANQPTPDFLSKFAAEVVNAAEPSAEFRRVTPYFETGALTIAAGQTQAIDLEVYLGPKGRSVLKTAYYADPPRDYDKTLVITGGLCAACTWQWLIDVLVAMLSFFHKYLTFGDWGLAIIILVFIVRAMLHPITKKSQVHMMKMQKMGPELEKIKKKYADNKEELARAQMAFYKQQGMTPVLGCLPMFLQMPIWIALWNSLQSTFELRHAPFLWGFTWIDDLAKPDKLVSWTPIAVPLPLCGTIHIGAINLLPLLLAVVFYLQTKYFTPKPPSMTPEQEQQQKMMTWMTTLLFPVMLYNGPSGLNLYIFASTLFGIIESKVIRQHIKEREALEAARGPTIVDAPALGKGGRGAKEEETGRKKGWFERLQEKADQVRKDAERKGKKRP